MEDFQNIMPVTKAKRQLLDILKVMDQEDSTIAFTRNGEPVCVIMTPRRYEALLETIEILADKDARSTLEASAEDFKSDRVYTHREVWDE